MNTRWRTEMPTDHSHRYVERMRRLAREGADLAGEARLVDAMVPRGARILDAGCGPGRVAAALSSRGHDVTGVDADEVLIEAAREDHPGPTFVVDDLSTMSLTAPPFDAIVAAGNVMVFLEPGTEGRVLSRLAAHLHPDGFVVTGFATDRAYGVAAFDADVVAAGLALEHRFATWDLRPWRSDAEFAVSVLRRPVP